VHSPSIDIDSRSGTECLFLWILLIWVPYGHVTTQK
jgi:hypothetical protein